MYGPLQSIRKFELERAREHLESAHSVLELGGGNGWQASILASWGVEVHSIDVAQREHSFHRVGLYDGIHIPYPDNIFDLIFSSNVLEHLEERPALFAEMVRVLKPDGSMVHIVPTCSWRFWTSLAHYPHITKRLVQFMATARSSRLANSSDGMEVRAEKRGKVTRLFLAPPHGVDGSVVKELYRYSRWGWRACFRAANLSVAGEYSTGIWYTGYALAPVIGLRSRVLLSRVAGSSCRVFVLRAPPPNPQ